MYLTKVLQNSTKHLGAFMQQCGSVGKYVTEHCSSNWESTIGLEVHAQISVASKLFSSSSSEFGLPTNSSVNLFDVAIPGTLPVLNKQAVELAVFTALALKCEINPISYFDRKHYFYSDLPHGFQITQQRLPLAKNGEINFSVFTPHIQKKPYNKISKIKQIQLEQDSGKSYQELQNRQTFVDMNRAGVALMEIVFEPDLKTAEEAAALIKELCLILQKLGSCSCMMEEGALRVDANVSMRKEGSELGVRTEIKNICSIRGVANAINYEISRQLNLIKMGKGVSNQTLMWDSHESKTVVMRDKEEKQDYRFMPEPNLLPLRIMVDEESKNFHRMTINKNYILDLRHLKTKLPALPHEERNLLLTKYKTSDLIAHNIVNEPILYKYFIDILCEDPARNVKTIYYVLMVTLLTPLNKLNIKYNDCNIPSCYLGELVDLLERDEISKTVGEKIVMDMLNGNTSSPRQIVKASNNWALSEEEVKKICIQFIEDNPKAVNDYLRGKKKVINFFRARVLQLTDFRAPTSILSRIITELLEAKRSK